MMTGTKTQSTFQPFERSQALLAAIVESSDDAILSKDLNGTITSWNRAAERMFGYTAEEIVGESILKLIPPELQSEEREILARLRKGERIEHYETIRMRKDGDKLELSLTISPVKDENGVTIGASKVARDISERRKMERVLIQSEKITATARMAATIAHEINNPLEAVMNLLYLARTSATVGDEARSYLVTAEQEIERVSMIARQTLGYFRESTSPVTLRLDEVLTQVLAVYQSKLVQCGVRAETSFEPSQGFTLKKGEITQVFSNLVSNAVDAMPEGGVLSMSVRETVDGGHPGVEVSVRDDGTGIAPELTGRIFEPFFTTKEGRGTGIGLWISRQIVMSHRGTLRVESSTEAPNRGSRFTVFLPYPGNVQLLG